MNRQIRRRLKRKGLSARQIMVYGHLHSHCYFGPRCWPSQKLIARRCGMSRQLVNAVCQELRDAGVLDWDRQHKRGSEYPVNVYTLRYWSRPKIAGTMRVLRRLNQCSKDLPDTKGQSRRALAPERDERHRDQGCGNGHRSLSADVQRTTSAGYVTTASGREGENELRRSPCMDPNRRLRAVFNPSLEAEPLVAELERKDQIIKTLQLELNRAMEDLAGMTEAARAAGRATVAAKGQRTRVAKAEARLEQLEAVVAHWRSHRPRTGPEFGTPGSKSFDIIEKALILMADDDAGPVGACNEAVDGLHLAPWQRYDQRFAKPAPDRILRNSVEHALGDEARIERCRRIARWVACNEARAFDMWRAACEVEQAWLRKWRQEHDRRDDAPRFIVDGIETRSDGG